MSNHYTVDSLVAAGFPDRIAATDGGCLEWQGARQSGKWDYGRTTYKGQWTSTHRLAWLLATGSAPPAGMFLRHACDNPPCVNPDHLSLGTPKDNTSDMDKRGRRVTAPHPGESNGSARLTAEQVARLRADRDAGMNFSQLGRKYSINKSHARRVALNLNWKTAA